MREADSVRGSDDEGKDQREGKSIAVESPFRLGKAGLQVGLCFTSWCLGRLYNEPGE